MRVVDLCWNWMRPDGISLLWKLKTRITAFILLNWVHPPFRSQKVVGPYFFCINLIWFWKTSGQTSCSEENNPIFILQLCLTVRVQNFTFVAKMYGFLLLIIVTSSSVLIMMYKLQCSMFQSSINYIYKDYIYKGWSLRVAAKIFIQLQEIW